MLLECRQMASCTGVGGSAECYSSATVAVIFELSAGFNYCTISCAALRFTSGVSEGFLRTLLLFYFWQSLDKHTT